MTLKYVGSKAFDYPLAEFNYEEEESERFMRIAQALEDEGYKIDTGVQGWAAIRVEDRSEFEEIKRIWKNLKRKIH